MPMPRLARIVVPGRAHHVTQRGNRREGAVKHLEDIDGVGMGGESETEHSESDQSQETIALRVEPFRAGRQRKFLEG